MSEMVPAVEPLEARPLNKGLKKNAISYASSVVIGVASTAPGYSLAAVLGLIVAIGGVGVHAPGVLMVSFVPFLVYFMLSWRGPRARLVPRPAGWAAGRSSSPTSS